MSTADDDQDMRDPLRAAFSDYVCAPRDVVPRGAVRPTGDLNALAGSVQQVVHYEMTDQGVTQYVEHLEICTPITERDRYQ